MRFGRKKKGIAIPTLIALYFERSARLLSQILLDLQLFSFADACSNGNKKETDIVEAVYL